MATYDPLTNAYVLDPGEIDFLTPGEAGDVGVIGNADNNHISGNAAGNTLDGGAGFDVLRGGAGDDVYIIDNDDAIFEGENEGTDEVRTSNTYQLAANFENLTFIGTANTVGWGNALDNLMIGNSGNNTFDGGAGADTLRGGSGNDTYVVDETGDVVTEAASEGFDGVHSAVSFSLGANLEVLVLTGAGDITGMGNESDNVIYGNDGDNTLDGGAGDDLLSGSFGNDVYIVDDEGDSLHENAGEGTDEVRASVNHTLGAFFENLILTGTEDLTGTGNDLGNVITGNSGDNVLDGHVGVDTLAGGAGNDAYIVDNSADVIEERGSEGTDEARASASYVLAENVEILVLTGSLHISGTGNGLDNVITGNDGHNTLDGRAGADTLTGGNGDDIYIVDNSGDIVVEAGANDTDEVRSAVDYTLGATLENLTLTGTADISGTGNAASNTITGNSGDNTLDGGGGWDLLSGGAGDDVYIVGDTSFVTELADEGIDEVRSARDHTLADNVENLTLTDVMARFGGGNALANIITGNGGDNFLDGKAGADTLKGGAGRDTYVLDERGDVVEELEDEGIDDLIIAPFDYMLPDNVEMLFLSGSGLVGTGNASNNFLRAQDGNNTLNGGAGNDSLMGGTGLDLLRGGEGDDFYHVDDVNDIVVERADEGRDTVYASVSVVLGANLEDLMFGGADNLSGAGNALDNFINGNDGNNLLTGGGGNDFINGGAGVDTIDGGTGDDTYVIDDLDVVLAEAADGGDDLVITYFSHTLADNFERLGFSGIDDLVGTGNALDNALSGNVGDNVLDGAAGADSLFGEAGADTLIGGSGDDHLDGGEGADSLVGGENADSLVSFLDADTDTLAGGDGDDAYEVYDAKDLIVEEADGGRDAVNAAINYTLGENFEILRLRKDAERGTGNALDNEIYGNSKDNTLAGGSGSDEIYGDRGTDLLTGDEGADYLVGGSGIDTMKGGAGNDTFYVQDAGDVVVEIAGEGTDLAIAYFSYALGDNVENLNIAGTGNFSGRGNALDNVIRGNDGDNLIDGGAGADTMRGLDGNDTYIIDNAGDKVVELEGPEGGVDTAIVSLDFSMAALANVEILKLADGTTATSLTGGAANDHLIGNTNFDILDGGAGADTLEGGFGSDVYLVDNAQDVVIDAAGAGIDAVQASVSYAIAADAEIEFLTALGSAALNLTGNAFANTLTGNGAVNVLDGGAGADKLAGGLGKDVLTGGAGRDIFVFNTKIDKTSKAKAQIDRIVDFNVRDDSVHMDNAIFTKLGKKGSAAKPATLNKAFFTIGTKAADANDYLIYNKKTGALFYDVDGNGSKAAIQIATFKNKLSLTDKDFLVI